MATVKIGDNSSDDHAGTEDIHIKEVAPNTNYETTSPLEITKYAVGDYAHMLLKFSGLSAIAGPVTVTSAKLYLYQSSSHVAATHDIVAKLLNRNWVENQATWNIYSTGNSWSTAGGLHETDDRSSTETFTVSIGTTVDQYYEFSSAQLATDVENIINGGINNYGWHLHRGDAGNDNWHKGFVSSDGADEQRPYLEVTYEVPTDFTVHDDIRIAF